MPSEQNRRNVWELAVDAVPVAVLVVDRSGLLAAVNRPGRRLCGLGEADLGREFNDLEIAERPVPLRSAVEQVQKEGRPLVLEYTPGPPGAPDGVEIHLDPITDPDGTAGGVALTFIEVPGVDRRAAYEELESANRELERTTGQLRATIGELEAMELQVRSTNGELETMNAELRSTKEQLQALADELQARTSELDEANDFLEAVLASQRGAVVVVDRGLRISVWTERSAEMWGPRPDEAPGQHFLNLDIGLAVEDLRDPLRAILAGDSDGEILELDASHRRGREFRCRVRMSPLAKRAGDVRGVILVMEET